MITNILDQRENRLIIIGKKQKYQEINNDTFDSFLFEIGKYDKCLDLAQRQS